jgi:hypothetical protein
MAGGEERGEAEKAERAADAVVSVSGEERYTALDYAVEDRSTPLLLRREQAIARRSGGGFDDRCLIDVSPRDVREHIRATMEITGASLADFRVMIPPPDKFDAWVQAWLKHATRVLLERCQPPSRASLQLLLLSIQSIAEQFAAERNQQGAAGFDNAVDCTIRDLRRFAAGGLMVIEESLEGSPELREAKLLSTRSSSQNGTMGAQKRHEASNERRKHYISFLDEHRDYFMGSGLLVKQIVAAIRDAEQGRSAFGWTLEPHPNGVLSTSALERLVSDWEKARGYVRRPGPPRKRRDRG